MTEIDNNNLRVFAEYYCQMLDEKIGEYETMFENINGLPLNYTELCQVYTDVESANFYVMLHSKNHLEYAQNKFHLLVSDVATIVRGQEIEVVSHTDNTSFPNAITMSEYSRMLEKINPNTVPHLELLGLVTTTNYYVRASSTTDSEYAIKKFRIFMHNRKLTLGRGLELFSPPTEEISDTGKYFTELDNCNDHRSNYPNPDTISGTYEEDRDDENIIDNLDKF
ncbi:MAG: hypothetical protein ACOX6V_03605 [Patescibacteria group bacterium]|jgi:hypothetical protein